MVRYVANAVLSRTYTSVCLKQKVRPKNSECPLFLWHAMHARMENLEAHRSLGDRRNVTTDVDPVLTPLTDNMNVQYTAATHLGSLFADKARAGDARYEAVSHHERGKWSRRAPGCRIFGNSVFGGEHA
jgi:hypothetical protein